MIPGAVVAKEPWAVFGPNGDPVYLGLHANEQDTWNTYLGWPDEEEIVEKERAGFRAEQIEVRVLT